jgi:protein phosphatase
LFREGGLKLLTQDHSLVNELFQKGGLTLEEAQNHPQRNILTRALGIKANPQIDLFDESVKTGDILLLCTDGLYNQVSDEEILNIIADENVLKVKVEKMINLALERGGNDNITVILVQYE